ncbi:MAG TPA: hypothetical protein VG940_05790 [Gemmatimonadales bacterium]|nr:hypothetical protein [Gemmatimonadales bacterium]
MSMRSLIIIPLLALAAACGSDNGPNGPPAIVGATLVSAGWDGTCAIGGSGGLACWGAAPTGTDADTGAGADLLGALSIPTPIDLIALSLDRDFAPGTGCAVGSTGQAYCWGAIYQSDVGQSIGAGIQPLSGFTSMGSIALGQHVVCGTRTDKTVRCAGWYTGGGRGIDSIGDPDAFDLTPNTLKPATSVFGTSIGQQFGCALRADSLAVCWGRRDGGRLGGATGDSLQNCGAESPAWCQPGPAPVAGGQKYRVVSVGGASACAVRIDGGVDCWGQKKGVAITGMSGLQCQPSDACLYTPTAIAVPGTAIRVGVGRDHACALITTGDVYCWGDNAFGQLGRPGAASLIPVKVSGGYAFVSLSVGAYHTCAIEAGSGAVGCWGANSTGQLGDGTTTDRSSPVAVVVAE